MPGMTPSSARMPATGVQVRGEPNWLPIWPARSLSDETRVTIAAAAMESMSAGSCATSASPTASTRDRGTPSVASTGA